MPNSTLIPNGDKNQNTVICLWKNNGQHYERENTFVCYRDESIQQNPHTYYCAHVRKKQLISGLTSIVSIGARVGTLALAQTPHRAFVVVHTFFIDGIYVMLWGP